MRSLRFAARASELTSPAVRALRTFGIGANPGLSVSSIPYTVFENTVHVNARQRANATRSGGTVKPGTRSNSRKGTSMDLTRRTMIAGTATLAAAGWPLLAAAQEVTINAM